MNEDGTMARLPELQLFCRRHELKMITVKDLIRHRMSHERLVRKIAEANLPTAHGAFRIHAFESLIDRQHNVALVMGEIRPEDDVLVRVHSQCLTGDIFHSSRATAASAQALGIISSAGRSTPHLGQGSALAQSRSRPTSPRTREDTGSNEAGLADQRDYDQARSGGLG
jgi:3,4-dihydroxy 2-butanone 4-phosphate synthase/GTP cyclohydrolase II